MDDCTGFAQGSSDLPAKPCATEGCEGMALPYCRACADGMAQRGYQASAQVLHSYPVQEEYRSVVGEHRVCVACGRELTAEELAANPLSLIKWCAGCDEKMTRQLDAAVPSLWASPMQDRTEKEARTRTQQLAPTLHMKIAYPVPSESFDEALFQYFVVDGHGWAERTSPTWMLVEDAGEKSRLRLQSTQGQLLIDIIKGTASDGAVLIGNVCMALGRCWERWEREQVREEQTMEPFTESRVDEKRCSTEGCRAPAVLPLRYCHPCAAAFLYPCCVACNAVLSAEELAANPLSLIKQCTRCRLDEAHEHE